MNRAFRALMAGIVDYAGLFPPAQLSLKEAIESYARYREEPGGWMLGRFVCPASRLRELLAFRPVFLPKLEEDIPFGFSILVRAAKGSEEFLIGLEKDLAEIKAFLQSTEYRVEVDLIEARLPDEALARHETERIADLLDEAAERMDAKGLPLEPFYEIPLSGDWRNGITAAVEAIAKHNAGRRLLDDERAHAKQAGLKVRCGGATADLFPTSEQLAFLIGACRDAGICWKATAGLHNPLRGPDPLTGAPAHGFLNLFGAGLFAHAKELDNEAIERILDDSPPSRFCVGDETFAWNDLSLPVADVARLRQDFARSFGSCSFDDPRAGLREIGYTVEP
ncbi:MAG: hypothetical protein ACE15D_17165 [Candidatus Eisenbacteria bacterium]|nr:hypothetical protein [Candidatus Eisenbacteria bacterium]